MNRQEIQNTKSPDQPAHRPATVDHYLRLNYPMEILEEEDGVVAAIPDLPGCASFGDTIEEAIRNLNATKELWIKGRVESGQPVPLPTQAEDFSGKFVLRIPRVLHRSLDREAKKQGVSLNQYILHLLSERNAITTLAGTREQTIPSIATFAGIQADYSWPEEGRVRQCFFSFQSATAKSGESLLSMLDFVSKPPKDFRIRVKQQQPSAAYEG